MECIEAASEGEAGGSERGEAASEEAAAAKTEQPTAATVSVQFWTLQQQHLEIHQSEVEKVRFY